jgi:hypothetical protein
VRGGAKVDASISLPGVRTKVSKVSEVADAGDVGRKDCSDCGRATLGDGDSGGGRSDQGNGTADAEFGGKNAGRVVGGVGANRETGVGGVGANRETGVGGVGANRETCIGGVTAAVTASDEATRSSGAATSTGFARRKRERSGSQP